MPATVHSANLGRWFEALCRIRIEFLREIVTPTEGRMKPGALPKGGGVYAFWWTGDIDLFGRAVQRAPLILKGPGGRPIPLQIDADWIGLEAGMPVPLYVGKSTGIQSRIGQHLKLGSKGISTVGRGAKKACQLRAGIDRFFPDATDTRTIVLDHIGLSHVKLDGDRHAANRFYLEDLAIGLMRPPLNVDVER